MARPTRPTWRAGLWTLARICAEIAAGTIVGMAGGILFLRLITKRWP